MVKCSKSEVQRLKTALRWKISSIGGRDGVERDTLEDDDPICRQTGVAIAVGGDQPPGVRDTIACQHARRKLRALKVAATNMEAIHRVNGYSFSPSPRQTVFSPLSNRRISAESARQHLIHVSM
jgi:hypothetical protein